MRRAIHTATILPLAVAALLAATATGCSDDGDDRGPLPDGTADAGGDAASGDATGEVGGDGTSGPDGTSGDGGGETEGPCDPVAQSGCDEGQKCTFLQTGDVACVSAGEVPVGEPCGEGNGSCAAGTCINISGNSVCAPYCNSAADCSGDDPQCIGVTDQPFMVCAVETDAESCNVLDQGCPEGQACYPGPGGAVCGEAGEGEQGSSCGADTDCAEGLSCTFGSCASFCDPEGGAGCPQDTTCLPFQSFPGACLASCDPLAQDCPDGEGCYPQGEQAACQPAGDKERGEVCEGSSECTPGHVCVGNTCLRICDPSAESPDCPGEFPNCTDSGYCDSG